MGPPAASKLGDNAVQIRPPAAARQISGTQQSSARPCPLGQIPGKRSAGRAAAKAAATDEALTAHAPVAHTARLKKSAPKPNKMRKGGAP